MMNQKIGWLIFLSLAVCILASACLPTPTPPASGKPSIILAAPAHGSQFREGDTVVVQSASGGNGLDDACGKAGVGLERIPIRFTVS